MTATTQIKITVKTLRGHGACLGQVKVFLEKFPKGVVLRSEEHAVRIARSVASVFDFTWAGEILLEGRFEDLYMEAREQHWQAYMEGIAPHWKAYREAEGRHWKAYREAESAHWKAYREAIATHRKDYEEAKAAHRKDYEEATEQQIKAYKEAKEQHWQAYMEAIATEFAKLYWEQKTC